MLGTYALSAGYYDAYYGKAQKVRTLIRRDFEQAFARVDAARGADLARRRRSSSARRTTRSQMYLNDVYTIPAQPGRPARPVGAVRLHRPGCRSACSSSGRRSTRRRCCARPTPTSSAHRLARRGVRRPGHEHDRPPRDVRDRHRPRGARAARDAHQDVLRLRRRRSARRPTPRPARSAWACPASLPVLNRRAVEFGDPRPRWRSAARSTSAAGSRASTTSTRTCRRTTRSASTRSRCRGRPRSTIDAGGGAARRSASSALHLEEDAGKLVHEGALETAPSSLRRLQPRRRAADGDRHRARPALARGGRRVPARRSAPSLRLPRRLRRQHGGGLAALRRQRLAAAARRRPSTAPRSRSRT